MHELLQFVILFGIVEKMDFRGDFPSSNPFNQSLNTFDSPAFQVTSGGLAYNETSPNVDITAAPGVSNLTIICGATFIFSNAGFGELSGTVTVTAAGSQTIVIHNALSLVFGKPVHMGVIPGATMIAANGSTMYPMSLAASPTDQDLTLQFSPTTTGTFQLTSTLFGVTK